MADGLEHDGWVRYFTDDGIPYYFHLSSQTTQWEAPAGFPEPGTGDTHAAAEDFKRMEVDNNDDEDLPPNPLFVSERNSRADSVSLLMRPTTGTKNFVERPKLGVFGRATHTEEEFGDTFEMETLPGVGGATNTTEDTTDGDQLGRSSSRVFRKPFSSSLGVADGDAGFPSPQKYIRGESYETDTSTSKWRARCGWCSNILSLITCGACKCRGCDAFWSDQLYGGRPAQQKCRCCRRCPRVRACCSRRATRWALLTTGLVVFIWLCFVINALVQYSKMANSAVLVKEFTVTDMCSYTPPFFMEVHLDNPASLSIDINSMFMEVYLQGSTAGVITALEFKPAFNEGGPTYQPGRNVLMARSAFHHVNTRAAGEVASLMLADAPNIPIVYRTTMSVTTPPDAFWFPITITTTREKVSYLNDQRPPEEREESSFGEVLDRPGPRLTQVEVNASSVSDVNGTGLQLLTRWTVYASRLGFNITVPTLYLQAHQEGIELAQATVRPFLYSFPSDAHLHVDVPYFSDQDRGMTLLQDIVGFINDNTTFYLNITGHSERAEANNHSSCMAQDTLNRMPTASVQVIPKPYDPLACENRPPSNPCSPTEFSNAQQEAESSSVKVYTVDAETITRPPAGGTKGSVSSKLQLNFDFDMSGFFPDIFIDAYSRGDYMGYVQIHRGLLSSRVNQTVRVTAAVIAERLVLERALDYTSVEALDLILQGRTGQNMLSSILAGWRLNITEALADLPAPAGVPTTAPTAAPTSAPTPAPLGKFKVATDYNATVVWVDVQSPQFSPALDFEVRVPRVVVHGRRVAPGGGASFGATQYLGDTGKLVIDPIVLPVGQWSGVVPGRLSVDRTQGPPLGALFDDLVQARVAQFAMNSSCTGCLSVQSNTLSVDVHLSFTLDQIMELLDNRTSTVQPTAAKLAKGNDRRQSDKHVHQHIHQKGHRGRSLLDGVAEHVQRWFAGPSVSKATSSVRSTPPSGRAGFREQQAPRPTSAKVDRIGVGPVELGDITLQRWRRDVTTGYHYIQWDMTVLFFEWVAEVSGRIPPLDLLVNVTLDTEVQQALLLSTKEFQWPPPASGSQPNNFHVDIEVGTYWESTVLKTVRRLVNGKELVKTHITGVVGQGVLSSVLSSFTTEVTLSEAAIFNVTESIAVVETSDSGGINWRPMTAALSTTTTSVAMNVDMELPDVSLPFNISIGSSVLQLVYEPNNAAKLSVLNLTLQEMLFCERDCKNYVRSIVDSVQYDSGSRLAAFINKLLVDESEELPMRLYGVSGQGLIDVEFAAVSPNRTTFFQDISNALSSSVSGDDNSVVGADTSNSSGFFTLSSFHILESIPKTSPIIIPCVIPSVACPTSSAGLTSSPIVVGLNFSIDNPLPMPLLFSYPAIELDFDCCIHTPVAKLGLRAGQYNSSDGAHLVAMEGNILDVDLVQFAVTELRAARNDFSFRVHGSSVNLLSALFSAYEEVITFKANEPCPAPCAPTPPVLSPWGKENLDFAYWLSATSSNSATFSMEVTVEWPMTLPLDMGEVELQLAYQGYLVGVARFPLTLRKGWNTVLAPVVIQGLNTSTSTRCGTKRFCVADEFLSRVIGSAMFPEGTNATLTLDFINLFGQHTQLLLDMVLYTTEVNPRAVASPTELGLVHDYSFKVTQSIGNLLLGGLSGSTFDFELVMELKNIFNFTLTVVRVQTDFLMRDFDGVPDYIYIPNTPMAPNEDYLIVDDGSHTLPNNWVVTPGQVRSTEVAVAVSYSGIGEKLIRIYDDYYIKNRFCGHVREGLVTLQLQSPGNDALTYTQSFRVDKFSAVGFDDCAYTLGCDAAHTLQWSYGFSSGGFNLVGDAATSGNTLVLTDSGGVTAAAWRSSKVYVFDRWQVEFDMKLTPLKCGFCPLCVDCPQADGIVFVVQNQASNAVGSSCTTGTCHAYKGISNSVGIVFNSYTLNSIGVFINGDADTAITQTQTPPEFDDGSTHNVRIQYHKSSKNFFIYLDNKIQLVANIDLENTTRFSFPDGTAYLGFTAATGSAAKSKQEVTNFKFSLVATSLSNSYILKSGQVRGRVGQSGFVTIDARDSCNHPMRSGGDVWTVSFVGPVTVPASSVVDHEDGTYSAYFTPTAAGTYTVMGSLPGQGSSSLGVVAVENSAT